MTANAPPLTTTLNRAAIPARRRHDLSSPTLVGSLLVIAALGVIAGLVLFGKLMADDVASQDRARVVDAASISAARIDSLLLRAEMEITTVVREVDGAATPLPPATLRSLRQDVAEMLSRGPLAGVSVLDENENVVLEVSQAAFAASAPSLAQPLESNANLLSSRLRMAASEDDSAPVLHFTSGEARNWRVVAQLDQGALLDALRPNDRAAGAISRSYLLDQEDRLLATDGDPAAFDRLVAPHAPYNAAPLEEASVTMVTDTSGDQRLFATTLLSGRDLRVVHIGARQGGAAVFGRAGALTIALVGPCLLGLMLLISVIQNEWRKNDRRANSAADAVARAEVASDLLQAGIVDWSMSDSSVVYTRGWHDLFGYADGVSGEQIFDWIGRIHIEDRADARTQYQRLMDGEATAVDHTIRVLCADGTYTHVRERAAVRSDGADRVIRVILVQTPYVLRRAEEAAA